MVTVTLLSWVLATAPESQPQTEPATDAGPVVEADEYVWGAVVLAGTAACCHLTAGVGCLACHGAGLIAHEEGSEALDGKCA